MKKDITKQLKDYDYKKDGPFLISDAAHEIHVLREKNKLLRIALKALVNSIEDARSANCINGWDFALTIPNARKVLGIDK